jgi:recombinational DNA repair protein (RecF pathway)
MSRPAQQQDIEQFERYLLRRGVGALEADRDRCADCGRTPLVGEHVHLYARVQGIVCELCSPLRREHAVATELVRHSEHGHTVRLRRAA